MQNPDILQVLLACDRKEGRATVMRDAVSSVIRMHGGRVWRVLAKQIMMCYLGDTQWKKVATLSLEPTIRCIRLVDKRNIFIFDGFKGVVYDTETGEVIKIRKPRTPRPNMAMAAMANGPVFVCGGVAEDEEDEEDPAKTATIYTQRGWTSLEEEMGYEREEHTCTTLQDGRIFIYGGIDAGTAEIFNPRRRSFEYTKSNVIEHTCHASVVLPTGDVLVCGGLATTSRASYVYSVGEDKWRRVGDMEIDRACHDLFSFNHKDIITIGGYTLTHHIMTAERYDVEKETWSRAPEYDLPPDDPTFHEKYEVGGSNIIFEAAD